MKLSAMRIIYIRVVFNGYQCLLQTCFQHVTWYYNIQLWGWWYHDMGIVPCTSIVCNGTNCILGFSARRIILVKAAINDHQFLLSKTPLRSVAYYYIQGWGWIPWPGYLSHNIYYVQKWGNARFTGRAEDSRPGYTCSNRLQYILNQPFLLNVIARSVIDIQTLFDGHHCLFSVLFATYDLLL